MSASWCPYCNSVKSLLLGHVFCSRQHKPMGELETGTLYIKSKSLEETDDHISRLSIRCMLNGEQYYRVGNHDHLVTHRNYLVINQGQHYRTSFSGDVEQEMILVAFKPGFAEGLLHSMITPEDILLDNPFNPSVQPILFFEKTYDHDPFISSIFLQLRKLIETGTESKNELDMDGLYTALLGRLLEVHRDLKTEINKLSSAKRSTKTELFRRLNMARDFMEANTRNAITLEDISKEACLSVHHFKREFKDLFGVSPHRYLVHAKLDKALSLLQQTSLSVDEVAVTSGFENTSSFVRLVKRHTGETPGNYRRTRK